MKHPVQCLDPNLRVMIKKGPVEVKTVKGPCVSTDSVQTSLKELEDRYAGKQEWKIIEDGGVLSIPVEEFRMINPPKPGRTGHVKFEKKKGKGAGNQIESYPVGQTIKNLNDQILVKYNDKKEKTLDAGKSKGAAVKAAEAMARNLPEFKAVQKWLDTEAEIELKLTIENIARIANAVTITLYSKVTM